MPSTFLHRRGQPSARCKPRVRRQTCPRRLRRTGRLPPTTWSPPFSFSLRRRPSARAVLIKQTLKPGGLLILQATARAVEIRHRWPPEADHLYMMIRAALKDMDILELRCYDEQVDEGRHTPACRRLWGGGANVSAQRRRSACSGPAPACASSTISTGSSCGSAPFASAAGRKPRSRGGRAMPSRSDRSPARERCG